MKIYPQEEKDKLLEIKTYEQYLTVDELFKASEANSIYYALLVLSTLIVTAGLLLSNSAIVIGGMLVTPVLTPLLVIALGITTAEIAPIRRESLLLAKSFFIIILSAAFLTIIFDAPESVSILENSVRTAALYFIIALAAGIAATFAWTRKEMAVALPGTAIAVSIVPPLALVGIGFSTFDLSLVRFYFFITVFNIVGIIIGSLIVFSLLKFYQAGKQIHDRELQTEIQEQKKKIKLNNE